MTSPSQTLGDLEDLKEPDSRDVTEVIESLEADTKVQSHPGNDGLMWTFLEDTPDCAKAVKGKHPGNKALQVLYLGNS